VTINYIIDIKGYVHKALDIQPRRTA